MRIFVNMKTRLNITVEETLVEKAKAYAAEKDLSLSQLVEDYFERIVTKQRRPSLLDVLDKLPKSESQYPEDFDFKKEYLEERKAKYGF